ncbi:hypothetical protein NY08_3130 [Rhodococcus sp. B7740]|nr:hypothetical protein NY08_3130 [Rhodococcus sp. B7740]
MNSYCGSGADVDSVGAGSGVELHPAVTATARQQTAAEIERE